MADVGLLIAFGVLMGAILHQTGAIHRLVEQLLRIFGPKRMPYTLALTIATALQSIFLDVLLVISAPLARNLANRSARMARADRDGHGHLPGVRHRHHGTRRRLVAWPASRSAARQDAAVRLLLVIPTVVISVVIMTFLFSHGGGTPTARSTLPR